MSKPDDVSQEAWDAACALPIISHNFDDDDLVTVARAIMAAVEAEREACASLAYVEAIKHCSARDGMRLIGHPVGHSIAAAIRQRGTP